MGSPPDTGRTRTGQPGTDRRIRTSEAFSLRGAAHDPIQPGRTRSTLERGPLEAGDVRLAGVRRGGSAAGDGCPADDVEAGGHGLRRGGDGRAHPRARGLQAAGDGERARPVEDDDHARQRLLRRRRRGAQEVSAAPRRSPTSRTRCSRARRFRRTATRRSCSSTSRAIRTTPRARCSRSSTPWPGAADLSGLHCRGVRLRERQPRPRHDADRGLHAGRGALDPDHADHPRPRVRVAGRGRHPRAARLHRRPWSDRAQQSSRATCCRRRT